MDAVIVERIKKLLNLAEKNANVHEAANAAGLAQKLMERYRIDQASLDTSETDEEGVEEDILSGDEGTYFNPWRSTVATALARANGCFCFTTKRDGRNQFRAFGRQSDMQVVRYMYQYLSTEIERLAKQAGKERGRPGWTWLNSFRMGAADEVANRLREASKNAQDEARAATSDGAALMVVNNAIVKLDQRYVDAHKAARSKFRFTSRGASSAKLDSAGYSRGKVAGAGIRLGATGPGLSAGAKGALR